MAWAPVVSIIFMAIFSLTSCAIRPDVVDVSNIETYDIVKRIRCEMRDAVRYYVRAAILRREPGWASRLQTDEDFLKLKLTDFQLGTQEIIKTYSPTIIGYDFTFDATEKNVASANVDILRTFTRGTLGLGFKAKNERQRNSVESFRTVDVFYDIVTGLSNKYCVQNMILGRNYVYPIAGKLGLQKIVKKYLDFNQSGNLTDKIGSEDIARYSATIKFTTIWDSNFVPNLDLPGRSRSWELIGVDGDLQNNREDVHTLALVFVLPSSADRQGQTIAQRRVQSELDYLRVRDDVRNSPNIYSGVIY